MTWGIMLFELNESDYYNGTDNALAGLSVFDDPVIRVLAIVVVVIWLLCLLASKANKPKK